MKPMGMRVYNLYIGSTSVSAAVASSVLVKVETSAADLIDYGIAMDIFNNLGDDDLSGE